MKKFLLPSIVGLFFLLPFLVHANSNLSDRLSGRILLQVEEKGEAWYIEPTTKERAFLGRPDDAFRVMRELGLGISEKDFKAFGQYAPERLSGRIILRVEAKGEAYYVNPVDLKMHFLGRPADAFGVMRQMGLGVTNQDIERVPVFQKYAQQTEDNSEAIKSLEEKLLEQNNKINELESQLNKVSTSTPLTCLSWAYSDWSDCSANGQQSRTIFSSLPNGCFGGNPILTQSCIYTPPTCSSWTYSDWSDCQPNNMQNRNLILSLPNGCSGGSPILTQSCSYYEEIEYSDYNLTYNIEKFPRSITVYFTNPTNRNIVIQKVPVTVADNSYETLGIYLRHRPRPGATNETIFLEKINTNHYQFIGREVSIKQPAGYLGVYERFVTLSINQDLNIDTNIKDWIIWDKDLDKQVLIK